MGKLKLPRLISNGVVLQQKKKIHIWGFDEPLRKVKVSFLGEDHTALTNGEGIWETWLGEQGAGGPYTMHISDDAGDEIEVSDILVGDVWVC